MLAPVPKAAVVLLDALGHAVHRLEAWGTVVPGAFRDERATAMVMTAVQVPLMSSRYSTGAGMAGRQG